MSLLWVQISSKSDHALAASTWLFKFQQKQLSERTDLRQRKIKSTCHWAGKPRQHDLQGDKGAWLTTLAPSVMKTQCLIVITFFQPPSPSPIPPPYTQVRSKAFRDSMIGHLQIWRPIIICHHPSLIKCSRASGMKEKERVSHLNIGRWLLGGTLLLSPQLKHSFQWEYLPGSQH